MSESEKDAVEFWEQRYGESEKIWSGKPNDALVAAVTGLGRGRALDLGCGEGGDSVWLAEQGWQVTAVDISATAIARARAAAAGRGVGVGRIDWLVEDLSSWQPSESYDLVSACFLQSPVEFPRTAVLRRAASAVAPGGHLLIVGHAEFPPWSAHNHDHDHPNQRFPSPAEERASLQLDDAGWDTVIGETRSREATGPDGEHATLHDIVTLLRRR